MSVTALNERPIKRWISSVRPPCLPLEASRTARSGVARGSMAYSAVTQPRFWPLRNGGTFSSTDTVQITLVSPISINTDPSAYLMKSRVILTGRSSSGRRPSTRIKVDPLMASHYTRPQTRAQFTRRHASQRQEDSNHRRHWRGFQPSPLVDSPEKPVLEWPTLMLDWRLMREHLEEVRARLGSRGADVAWDELRKLLEERRSLTMKIENTRHDVKEFSAEIAKLMREKRFDEVEMRKDAAGTRTAVPQLGEWEKDLRSIEERLTDLALRIPNVPHSSVPDGNDPSENQEIRRWGAPPRFSFRAQAHWDLGQTLGILDFERAAR